MTGSLIVKKIKVSMNKNSRRKVIISNERSSNLLAQIWRNKAILGFALSSALIVIKTNT